MQPSLNRHMVPKPNSVFQRFGRLAGLCFAFGTSALRTLGVVSEVVQDLFLIEVIGARRFDIFVVLCDAASEFLQAGLRVRVC